MWTDPQAKPKLTPADSLARYFETLAAAGWEVKSWKADHTADPIYLGTRYGDAVYTSGLRQGTLTVQLGPKPATP